MKDFILKKIPEDLHARLKGMAGFKQTTMRELILRAIQELLDRLEKNG